MDLVVRSDMNSEAYTLKRIIVDPGDGIIFECLTKDNRLVTVRPPRLIRDATVEINPRKERDKKGWR